MTISISATEAIQPTVFPARKVLLEFSHPTIGNDDIAHLISQAMHEFHLANPMASTSKAAFIASNGVMVRFHAPEMHPA